MGLTFPTAFVKKQTVEFDDPTIAWNTGLYWSHDDGQNHVGDTVPFPIKHSDNSIHPYKDGGSSYPFEVLIIGSEEPTYDTFGNETEEYYFSYGIHTALNNIGEDAGNSTVSPQVYYAWYLTGGYSLAGMTTAPHRSNPWEVTESGKNVRIYFESDWETASLSGLRDSGPSEYVDLTTKFNQFIQSGSATGSFSLSTSKTLQVEVSGLGQDNNILGDVWSPSSFLDYMELSIYNGSSSTILCSGKSPEDDRNNLLDEYGATYNNYDMQQVKLFSGGNAAIVNYQGKNGGSVDVLKGAPRSNPGEWVNEDDRNANGRYVNSNGTGVFATTLGAGSYEIRINASSNDGAFNSGAFYGFTFTFL